MRNLWSPCAPVSIAALILGGSVSSSAQSTWLTQATPHFEIFYERDPSEQRLASLTHELTHHFTWELTPPDRELVPAWLEEGLSEYERVRWTGSTSPARTYSTAPAISQIASSDRDSSRRVFEFIGDEFGTDGIRRHLTSLKHATTSGSALHDTFGLGQDEFDRAFQQYLRTH